MLRSERFWLYALVAARNERVRRAAPERSHRLGIVVFRRRAEGIGLAMSGRTSRSVRTTLYVLRAMPMKYQLPVTVWTSKPSSRRISFSTDDVTTNAALPGRPITIGAPIFGGDIATPSQREFDVVAGYVQVIAPPSCGESPVQVVAFKIKCCSPNLAVQVTETDRYGG
jgi:hypothetical protein